jgi:hypothetical protein
VSVTFLADLAAQALADQQAARAAAQAQARDELVAAARARLAVVLGDEADVGILAVEDVQLDERLVVVSDARTCLAVQHAGDADAPVWLVTQDGTDVDGAERWVQAAQVDSLPALGEALATRAQAATTTEGGDAA